MVYLEEIKLLSRITCRNNVENYTKHPFKLYLFEDEEKVEVVKVKKCFIENINESLYLYEHTTNNFIGQGKSLDALSRSHGLRQCDAIRYR